MEMPQKIEPIKILLWRFSVEGYGFLSKVRSLLKQDDLESNSAEKLKIK